jgi:hypothetical protein
MVVSRERRVWWGAVAWLCCGAVPAQNVPETAASVTPPGSGGNLELVFAGAVFHHVDFDGYASGARAAASGLIGDRSLTISGSSRHRIR